MGQGVFVRLSNESKISDIKDIGTLDKARRLAKVLVDKKIRDVWVIDVGGLCSYADCLILGDAETERHMQAALDALDEELSKPGFGLSPERGARWTLLDLGEIVVDLFLPEVRGIYRLEDLYSDATIFAFDEAGKERRVLPVERLTLYSSPVETSNSSGREIHSP